MKLRDLYQQGLTALSAQMDEGTAGFEVSCLLQHCFAWNKTQLLLHEQDEADTEKSRLFLDLLHRRCQAYPLQYLLGSWEFYGYPFVVGEGVLIPRADTEILCETVIEAAQKIEQPLIADLCSGSGCLPVSYSKELPNALRIYAVELSEQALPYLQKNVEQNHCQNICIVHDDVLRWTAPEPLHIISANPPYLSEEDMQHLQSEVRFEPKMALEAPENGLYFYRVLAQRCYEQLLPGGLLAFEVGWTQANAVADLLRQAGYQNVQIRKDYSGNDRVVTGQRSERNV